MPANTTLRIRQNAPANGKYPILLTLKRPGQPDLEAEATIEFALTPQEQGELKWYLEDYLQRAECVEQVQVEQIENLVHGSSGPGEFRASGELNLSTLMSIESTRTALF